MTAQEALEIALQQIRALHRPYVIQERSGGCRADDHDHLLEGGRRIFCLAHVCRECTELANEGSVAVLVSEAIEWPCETAQLAYTDGERIQLGTRTILEDLLAAQREWSLETFGPGTRLAGLLDHLRKELKEVEDNPDELEEWIDVAILAFDGAWRSGHTEDQIVAALVDKYARNRARRWPDWRTADPDAAIEHVREASS